MLKKKKLKELKIGIIKDKPRNPKRQSDKITVSSAQTGSRSRLIIVVDGGLSFTADSRIQESQFNR